MKYMISISFGMVIGILSMAMAEYAIMALFPVSDSIDFQDITSISDNLESIPQLNLILILVGYALSSALAGFFSTKIKTANHYISILAIGVGLTFFGFLYLLIVPHPLWMVIIGSMIFLPMTWLGGKICNTNSSKDVIYKF